jgi:hypothetical protein
MGLLRLYGVGMGEHYTDTTNYSTDIW